MMILFVQKDGEFEVPEAPIFWRAPTSWWPTTTGAGTCVTRPSEDGSVLETASGTRGVRGIRSPASQHRTPIDCRARSLSRHAHSVQRVRPRSGAVGPPP